MKYTDIDDLPLDPALVEALYPPNSLLGLRKATYSTTLLFSNQFADVTEESFVLNGLRAIDRNYLHFGRDWNRDGLCEGPATAWVAFMEERIRDPLRVSWTNSPGPCAHPPRRAPQRRGEWATSPNQAECG